jgi:hypothetical protein
MAEAKTNPVLEIIDLDNPLQENKKYPSDLMQFNQMGWRAYYHCHPASRDGDHRFKGEHGHFHIFIRTQKEPEAWAHLAALAMDNMGQPLGWFTVNHWVTGENWGNAEDLLNYLQDIPFNNQVNLVERWLLSLLALSYDAIKTVLNERDKVLEQKKITTLEKDVMQDRNIYLLSEVSLDIKELFINL